MRLVLLFLVACGGRLADDDASFEDAGPDDAPISKKDARVTDAPVIYDATEEKPPPGPCTIGPNLGLPLAQCSAAQDLWFASPYVPPGDISVMRMEAFMRKGSVAILASSNGEPGAPITGPRV